MVSAQQEDAVGRLAALEADQVSIGRDQAEQVVGIALDKQFDWQLARGIGRVGQLEGFGIADAFQSADVRPPDAILEQRDTLWRDETAARVDGVRVSDREEIGEDHHEVEQADNCQADDGEPMAAEPPPG